MKIIKEGPAINARDDKGFKGYVTKVVLDAFNKTKDLAPGMGKEKQMVTMVAADLASDIQAGIEAASPHLGNDTADPKYGKIRIESLLLDRIAKDLISRKKLK